MSFFRAASNTFCGVLCLRWTAHPLSSVMFDSLNILQSCDIDAGVYENVGGFTFTPSSHDRSPLALLQERLWEQGFASDSVPLCQSQFAPTFRRRIATSHA